MASLPNRFFSPQEYLALERAAESKSEYYAGEMVAMSGASRKHGLLVANALAGLHPQLKKKPCEIYASDMRVRVTPAAYVYPDVVICCGEPQFEDDHADTLTNPTVIFEMLPKSTEDWDQGGKFERYRRMESLKDYILVSQSEYLVEHRTRQSDSTWLLTEIEGPQGVITINSIGCTLTIADLYERVAFEDSGNRTDEGTSGVAL